MKAASHQLHNQRNAASTEDTTTEPSFTRWMNKTITDTQFLKEWLVILLEANDQEMKLPNRNSTYADKFFAEEIFIISKAFRLSPQAQFLACAIFDKFMYEHLTYLYDYVQQSTDKMKTWDGILLRIKKQLLLRLVTCCQLASKTVSHYNIITVQRAQVYLRKHGQRYAGEAILQSELRVLKTLDYKVCLLTPSIYIETFLAFIGLNMPNIDVQVVHTLCVDLLMAVFMQWTLVYERLHQMVLGTTQIGEENRRKFSVFERDNVLLAGALVTAASQLTNPDDRKEILDQVVLISKAPADDFVDLASIILDMMGSTDAMLRIRTKFSRSV